MFKALHNPQIRWLWFGQVLSQMGTRMYGIALSWYIINSETTSIGLKMGILLILGALPAILLAAKIGSLIDQISRKKILMRADFFGAMVALGLALWVSLVGPPSLPLIYFVGLLLASTGAFIDPCLNKFVNQLASPQELSGAVALITSTTSFSFLGGALIGATAIGWLGLEGTLWINGLSYLAAVFLTQRVKELSLDLSAQKQDHVHKDDDVASRFESSFVIFSDSPIHKLMLGFAMVNFFSSPLFVLLPLDVKFLYHGSSANTLAFLEGGLYLGGVLGPILASYLTKYDDLFNPLRIGAQGILAMGVFILGLSFVRDSTMAFFLLLGAATSIGIGNVYFISFFQKVIPDADKGKFFARLAAMATFAFPVSFFLFGFLADHVSLIWLHGIQGLGVIFLSALFYRWSVYAYSI